MVVNTHNVTHVTVQDVEFTNGVKYRLHIYIIGRHYPITFSYDTHAEREPDHAEAMEAIIWGHKAIIIDHIPYS